VGALLDRHAAYVLIAPTLVGVIIVDVYPLIFNTLISLQVRKISTAQPHFVGLQNYANVIRDPEMLHSLKVSIIFTVVSVCFSYIRGYSWRSCSIGQSRGEEVPASFAWVSRSSPIMAKYVRVKGALGHITALITPRISRERFANSRKGWLDPAQRLRRRISTVSR
jgi:hypothetical protein